jgi:two-component system LytT family response regulator
MKKIKCIIVDDEPLAIKLLVKYATEIESIDLVGTFNSSIVAQNFIEKEEVDLVFLDINMPDLNGLDFIKTLTKKPVVVFTTAYPEYALEGFKLDAVDYILKPICFPDFLKSVNKAKKFLSTDTKFKSKKHITVKSDYKTIVIEIDNILYIESLGDYLKIIEKDKSSTITRMTLKTILELLTNNFMRVNKSFIVNLTQIREISRNRIFFENKEIPIGEKYKDEFYQYFS